MKSLVNKLSTLSLVMFCLSAFGVAHAADRHVTVINDSSYTLTNVYGSNVYDPTLGPDWLGYGVLRPGQSARINFDDGTGACHFDLEAVFSSGDVLSRPNVNVCVADRWTIGI
jgi:hypothetical protein